MWEHLTKEIQKKVFEKILVNHVSVYKMVWKGKIRLASRPS